MQIAFDFKLNLTTLQIEFLCLKPLLKEFLNIKQICLDFQKIAIKNKTSYLKSNVAAYILYVRLIAFLVTNFFKQQRALEITLYVSLQHLLQTCHT